VTVRIEADRLVPGRGVPVDDAIVVLDARRIAYAGGRDDAPAAGPGDEVVRVPTVMPGLWECHGHLMGMRSFDLSMLYREPTALHAVRIAADLRLALHAGVTSVREAGGHGIHVARAVDEGTIPGPAVYAAGAILSTTGGHADDHDVPLSWVHEMAHTNGLGVLCDGVPGVMAATREQLRKNARVIKVCASGGVLSAVDHPIHQQFTIEELRTIVEIAGMAERVVMAHCHGKPGIVAALEAGVKTIEHGSYMDEETSVMMVEQDALLVPTRYVIEQLLQFGRAASVDPRSMVKVEAFHERHLEDMTIAHDNGVRFAMGTDIALSGPDLPNAWGQNGRELPLMAKFGLSSLEIIEASTANGPDTLGPQAPMSGQLVEGYDADVIAVAGDPVADISLVADPDNITHVWKAGALVKGPVPESLSKEDAARSRLLV